MMAPNSLARVTNVASTAGVEQLSPPALALTLQSGLELSVYDDLVAVAAIWRDFQRTADCTAFQTFDWLSAWQRHIGSREGVAPSIIIARDFDGTVLFILPLAIRAAGFARELAWLGSDLCDYNTPLLARMYSERLGAGKFAPIWHEILRLLQTCPGTRFDFVRLEKMPETVRSQPNPMLELTRSLNPSGSYATPLAQSWDAFYAAKRSPSTRRRDRTKRKRLAEFGDIELVTAKTAGEALDSIAILIKQKSAYFARLGISNLFGRPGYFDFLRDFASEPETSGLWHVSELRVGSQVAAVNLALTLGGRYYHVFSSYTDGDLARLGPGAVHLHELLRYAIDHQFTVFDFTIGDERYKLDWCDGARPLYDHFSASNWRGMIATAAIRKITKLKRTIKQTPVLWAWFNKVRVVAGRLRSPVRGKFPETAAPGEG